MLKRITPRVSNPSPLKLDHYMRSFLTVLSSQPKKRQAKHNKKELAKLFRQENARVFRIHYSERNLRKKVFDCGILTLTVCMRKKSATVISFLSWSTFVFLYMCCGSFFDKGQHILRVFPRQNVSESS